MKNLNSKLATIVVLLVGFLLSAWNPFNFAPFWTLLYYLAVSVPYILFAEKASYRAKGLSDEEKKYINEEKLKSIFRSIVQVIGALIMLQGMFHFNIPYLDTVNDIVNYLATQIGVAAQALNTLIGIGIAVWGFIIHSKRFESRALIAPTKIDLK